MRAQVAELTAALEQARRENTLRRQKLDALARRCFGKSSEQLDAAQLERLWSGLSAARVAIVAAPALSAPPTARRSEAGSRRVRVPDHLEVVRVVIEPELVLAEPAAWRPIGEEVSRQLDYPPASSSGKETVRPK